MVLCFPDRGGGQEGKRAGGREGKRMGWQADRWVNKRTSQGEWAWHWWHAKTHNGEMHKMWNELEEKVLYILIDYEDLPP